ncbi:MAG: preprotein translocase subunit SecG [Luteolibacter sp.]|nr:preprotein translocase subunit SecG [Luteolibacter sp.]
MNLAAIDWLSISINLLLAVFVIVCLLMTLLILMQRPKQEGLGAAFGGGVTDQVFGARTTNVLQRGTVYLASLFFLLSLALAVLIGQQNKKITISPDKTPPPAAEVAKPATDDASAQPKSLSEELPVEESAPVPAVDTTSAPAPAEESAPVPAEVPAGESAPAPADESAPADASVAPEEKSDNP